ncbi:MAG TPA: DUF2721 domain-containing protein [Chitinophagaceae bacterium]|nr:DUF2721 domain-containing protein [Chitinophagaceae bacterium]
MELSINIPALLFPGITLLMLAYTNRFLALASLVRKLHEQYSKHHNKQNIINQIRNLRGRLHLIRYMQAFGVLSFLLCMVCMYMIFRSYTKVVPYIFAASIISLIISLLISLIEILQSTKALELELSDIEELAQSNVFKDLWKNEDEEEEDVRSL